MSGKLIAMGALALTFGATSYYAGNTYLENQTQARLSEFERNLPKTENREIELQTIVVASSRIEFGQVISQDALRVVKWPADEDLPGAFNSLDELQRDNPPRALASIQPGEPILAAKITSENAKAGLAGIIAPGMRAVTISVNEVSGVGGFVQPGDRVDIVLTSSDEGSLGPKSGIVMQNVKVLSVDQQASERFETAQVASSVTLEVDTKGAQTLTTARSLGSLSLLLRGAGDTAAADGSLIDAATLGLAPKQGQSDQNPDVSLLPEHQAPTEENQSRLLQAFEEPEPTTKAIRVIRRDQPSVVNVPIEAQLKKKKQEQEGRN